ncbi:MAG: glycosyltransferase family 2 protein [Granulosicoccus sp.]
MTYCWVVPHYNHATDFRTHLLPRLVDSVLPCIVVDDGSDPSNLEQLKTEVARYESITLVQHESNQGKGAAVLTGCRHARTLGFTHIIQIDADGQHEPADASRFISASQNAPRAIVSGYPIFDESVPKVRKYGRRITTFWVMLETCSLQIKDALCGYRVYPLDTVEQLVERFHFGHQMEFDTEILVKAVWQDVPIVFIDTKVQYFDGGISHFHYTRDNLNLIKLHTGLMLRSFLRVPTLLLRRLRK